MTQWGFKLFPLPSHPHSSQLLSQSKWKSSRIRRHSMRYFVPYQLLTSWCPCLPRPSTQQCVDDISICIKFILNLHEEWKRTRWRCAAMYSNYIESVNCEQQKYRYKVLWYYSGQSVERVLIPVCRHVDSMWVCISPRVICVVMDCVRIVYDRIKQIDKRR